MASPPGAPKPPLPVPDRATLDAELATAYEQSYAEGELPATHAMLLAFHDGTPDERRLAASRIVEILQKLLDDEMSGGGGRKITPVPYWGGSAERTVRAHEIRLDIHDAVGSYFPRDEVFLPVLRWTLFHEPDRKERHDMMIVLHRIGGPEATALVADLVRSDGTDDILLAKAAEELILRDPALAATLLRPHVHHRNAGVREVARALLTQRGETLPDIDPAAQLAPLAPLLKQVLDLLPEQVTGAPVVVVRYLLGREGERELRGFLLPNDGPTHAIRLLTVGMAYAELSDADGSSKLLQTSVPIEEEVARIEAVRARLSKGESMEDAAFSDSEMAAQFERADISAWEIVMAAHLLETGNPALAARVLLPPLQNVPDPAALLPIVRQSLGTGLFHRALELFAGERDYAGAAGIAALLRDRYTGFAQHADAARLAAQLPLRLDEFTTLRMPTAAEWSALSKGLSREEQIAYLCGRLRMLNAFQYGQPGGPSFIDPQYAEASGMLDAAWARERGRTEVLNPLAALHALEPRFEDVPALAAHLLDDRILPTVGFWRSFHPARQLFTVGQMVAGIIDGIAGKPLASTSDLTSTEEAVRRAHVEKIVQWSRSASGMSESARLLGILAEQPRWFAVPAPVLARIEDLKLREAIPLLARFLEQPEVSHYEIAGDLRFMARLDGPSAARHAAWFLNDPHPSLKLDAGLIVFRFGDRDAGRRALREAIAEGTYSTLPVEAASTAAEALLETGEPEDYAAAVSIVQKDYFSGAFGFSRAAAARVLAGRDAGVERFYLGLLDDPATARDTGGRSIVEHSRSYDLAAEAIDCFGRENVGFAWPQYASREQRDAALERLRIWLRREIWRIEARQPSLVSSPTSREMRECKT